MFFIIVFIIIILLIIMFSALKVSSICARIEEDIDKER